MLSRPECNLGVYYIIVIVPLVCIIRIAVFVIIKPVVAITVAYACIQILSKISEIGYNTKK